MITIRLANPSDALSILEIYAPYILNTAFTFETEVPEKEIFEKRIISYMEKWPWLLYEIDKNIAGYAYATHHRERAAYQWCVESSIYVHPDFQGKGVAGKLYHSLFGILKFQGFRNVYAGITLPNDKSVNFHKKFGFNPVGDYKKIGYKLNKWHTVSWWELQLNSYSIPPDPPIKFSDLEPAFIDNIINNKSY